ANTDVRIVVDQQLAVQVGVIDQGREVGGRRDRQRAFDHAPHHDLQVVSAGQKNHLQRGIDASALHELDVDSVHVGRYFRHIRGYDAAFVGDDRERDALPYHAECFEIVPVNRLLDEFQIKYGQRLDSLD